MFADVKDGCLVVLKVGIVKDKTARDRNILIYWGIRGIIGASFLSKTCVCGGLTGFTIVAPYLFPRGVVFLHLSVCVFL